MKFASILISLMLCVAAYSESRTDRGNSSTTALSAGATFTGDADDVQNYSSVIVAVKTDQSGTMYMEFSPDGQNWDSSFSFTVEAGLNEVHRLTVTRQYYRTRFTNTSASPQTYMRLQTSYGDKQIISAPANTTLALDADAISARTVSEEFDIALNKRSGMVFVNKFGRNPDIDTGTVPEDVWNSGGTATGFPTNTPEEIQLVSSSASDTGTVTFSYLASTTSTAYVTASFTLTGTTPVNTGITAWRVHTANYSSGAATTFNVGDITIRQRTTTANVFLIIPVGRSQSNNAGYTVPAGHTAVIKRLFCRVIGATTGQVDGSLWVRALNGSPRLRRPFAASAGAPYQEDIYGGISIPAGTDLTIRISASSANNLEVTAGYDLVLVDD